MGRRPRECDSTPVRRFRSFTEDLNALAKWLEQCGMQTVAFESTGVYWIPLFEILERRGFEVVVARRQAASRGSCTNMERATR